MPGLALFGMALFAAALLGMFSRVKNQKTTTGTVVSLVYRRDPGEKVKYYAWVEYEVGGNIYSVRTRYQSSSFRTGQKLKVAYNDEYPKEAIVRPTISGYLVVLGLATAAVVVTLQSF